MPINPSSSLRVCIVSTLPIFGFLTLPTTSLGVFGGNVVGYVNYDFHPGGNLFGNPLQSTNNFLSSLFPSVPDGTTVSKWDPFINQYVQTATFDSLGIGWSVDLELSPGMGALLNSPSLFTNTFVGEVLNPDGTPYDGMTVRLPSPFAGPPGNYLFSSRFPAALGVEGRSVFEYVLGRAPMEGEQFTTLDPLTQQYHTTTFIGGVWNNGEPMLGVGEAGFFNLTPVPEPGTIGLVLLGGVLAGALARGRKLGRCRRE